MARYKATNGKIVDTDRMELVADLDFEGQYGNVSSELYRTPKSHNWYIVSESSWAGNGSISDAEAISLKEAAALVMEHCDGVDDYPELIGVVMDVIDE